MGIALAATVRPQERWWRALDRPAREALELGREPFVRTGAMALAGLGALAASSVAANALLGDWSANDGLGGALEALLIALPGLLVFATYWRVGVPLRSLAAALAIGLWTAGVVAACLLPLLAFVTLAARGELYALHLRGVLVPAVGLAVAVSVPVRVIDALDRSARARWLARLFLATVSVAFLFKLFLAFPFMLDLSRW